MKNSTKNSITNIIGILLLITNVIMYYHKDESLISFLTILAVSLGLFLFKGTETKEWIRKALNKLSK
jgi:uncharacterized membrane protein